MWGRDDVRAIVNARRFRPAPRICNSISRARLEATHPLEVASQLRALADAALGRSLASTTQGSYASHVNYFFEFCSSLHLDFYTFGAPAALGGLDPAEEETVGVRTVVALVPALLCAPPPG